MLQLRSVVTHGAIRCPFTVETSVIIRGHSMGDLWRTKCYRGGFLSTLLPFSRVVFIPLALRTHLYPNNTLTTSGRNQEASKETLSFLIL